MLHYGAGDPLPAPNAAFLGWVVVGGLAQIAATFLLIHLFSYRNFAVGTAYSRTEPAQAALFALLFFSETVSAAVLAAIAISVCGVMLISVAHMELTWRNLVGSIVSRNALIGLASGTFFGIAAVAYRAASLALGGPNFMMQAAVTLAFTILLQTVVMAGWMVWRDRAEIWRIARAWKLSLATGLAGATASFGWFMAMTLQQAAVVKALAQVEMLFTFAASVFFFREKINRIETAGCLLIVAGILALLLAR
jgi:drug/metabolite transporter (DMT)-like permease